MKIESKDLIRIIVIIGAFLMFGVGAFMMWKGISAEGSIDLKSSILSGSIETGSAGLFISFLSFFIIVTVIITLGVKSPNVVDTGKARHKKVLPIFWGLLVTCIGSTILASIGYGKGFGILAAVAGFFLFMTIVAMLTFIEYDR